MTDWQMYLSVLKKSYGDPRVKKNYNQLVKFHVDNWLVRLQNELYRQVQ